MLDQSIGLPNVVRHRLTISNCVMPRSSSRGRLVSCTQHFFPRRSAIRFHSTATQLALSTHTSRHSSCVWAPAWYQAPIARRLAWTIHRGEPFERLSLLSVRHTRQCVQKSKQSARRACPAPAAQSMKSTFNDNDIDTDTDILAWILADTSDMHDFLTRILARMPMSVSWNVALTART